VQGSLSLPFENLEKQNLDCNKALLTPAQEFENSNHNTINLTP
jgi:hypothetical protein